MPYLYVPGDRVYYDWGFGKEVGVVTKRVLEKERDKKGHEYHYIVTKEGEYLPIPLQQEEVLGRAE